MALGIIKVKLLPFKAFKRVGNHGKRALHVRILLQIKCTEHLNLRLFQWMALGLARSGELMRRQKRETVKMVGVFYWQYQLNDVWQVTHPALNQLNNRPCKGIRIPESCESFACGIRNPRKNFFMKSGSLVFGIWNTDQGIPNPINDWNPESKFHGQRLDLESRIPNCLGFPYIRR